MPRSSLPVPLRNHVALHYGPWAVVTGASGGIGRALARGLADAEVSLVLVARGEERLRALAEELTRTRGIETRTVSLDLTRRDAARALDEVTRELDVGLLVASAGFGGSGLLVDAELDEELDMIDLNCRSVMALSHLFGRRLARRGRGGLVLMSSLHAFQGVPRAANYAATKAYVQSLAEGLGHELSQFGVDVLACAPGPVESGFAARAGMRIENGLRPEALVREILAALGRKRVVRPGLRSKALELSLALLPRFGRVLALRALMGGMTKHQAPRSLPA